jgi:hypothetical protein
VSGLNSSVNLRFASGSHFSRVGFIPMCIAIGLGWIFMVLWLVTAIFIMPMNIGWAVMLMLSVAAFSFYLSSISYNLACDCMKDYVLEVNESEVVLKVTDRIRKKVVTQMVLLDDVSYVEYFPSPDTATMILHSSYIDMEVPLWPMGYGGQDVVAFIEGRGVKVVNLQSDDKLPD